MASEHGRLVALPNASLLTADDAASVGRHATRLAVHSRWKCRYSRHESTRVALSGSSAASDGHAARTSLLHGDQPACCGACVSPRPRVGSTALTGQRNEVLPADLVGAVAEARAHGAAARFAQRGVFVVRVPAGRRLGVANIIEKQRLDRLLTDSRFVGRPIPLPYAKRIASAPGVTDIAWTQFLPGYYQDRTNGMLVVNTVPERWFAVRNEFQAPLEAFEAMKRTRTGILVRDNLAAKLGWKVGDRVTLQMPIAKKDGSTSWTARCSAPCCFSRPTRCSNRFASERPSSLF